MAGQTEDRLAKPKNLKPMRSAARSWLTALLLALLFLNAAELAATPYFHEAEHLFREDPLRFWALNEGRSAWDMQSNSQLTVNSLGMRGGEVPPPEAGPRVLLMGDSCIYGAGMPDSLTPDRLLQAELQERTGVSWQACNGGVPGYSSLQGLHHLRELGPTIRPEVVVFAYLHADQALERVPDHARLAEGLDGLRTLLWKSKLYRVLRAKVIGRPTSAGLKPDDFYEKGQVHRVPLDRHTRNLRELAAEARRDGARAVVFLVLPNLSPHRQGDTPHIANLKKVGAEEGIVVDLLGKWRADGVLDASMFLPNDPLHFNEAGNRRLAADLAEALVAAGVTPGRE